MGVQLLASTQAKDNVMAPNRALVPPPPPQYHINHQLTSQRQRKPLRKLHVDQL